MKTYLTKTENAVYVRAWLSLWIQLRRYCELEWEYFYKQRDKPCAAEVNNSTPESVVAWGIMFKKIHGRKMPAVVCAAGAFRRDFVRLVSAVLPEARIEPPSPNDSTEKAMADSPRWEIALEIALAHVEEIKRVILSKKPRLRFGVDTHPSLVLDRIQELYESRLRALRQQARLGDDNLVLRPLSSLGYIIVPANPISEAIVESLVPGPLREIASKEIKSLRTRTVFWRGRTFGKNKRLPGQTLKLGLIGFKEQPEDYVWKLLEGRGAQAIKAHYVLWARWAHEFGDTVAHPGRFLTLTLPQFCDDLGFEKNKDDHRSENKKVALDLLKLLTTVEFVCRYQPPRGADEIISGPLWIRGNLNEGFRGFEDIFLPSSGDTNSFWINKAFSYAPGPIFASELWQKINQFNAKLNAMFLKLTSENKDKNKLIIAAYLATLVRVENSQPVCVRAKTLVEKTGLLRVDGKRNAARIPKKVATVLNDLEKLKIIESWQPESEDFFSMKKWLKQSLYIKWPEFEAESPSTNQRE